MAMAPWPVNPYSPYLSSEYSEAISPDDSASNLSARHMSAPPRLGSRSTPAHEVFNRPSHPAALLGCVVSVNQWTPQKQQDFEQRLGRITALCRFPFTWIQHPEVILSFDLIAPYATLPSRFKLSRQIIPNLTTEFREQSKLQAANGFATIQADGWM